ncbi:uncharacterized protein LOC126837934 [Adelges cooleyi]|uniref:uncharacterized protein LOC126837934 n=1 Tax=Adelges cooleyi TaxID=133065 RepID=UPI00217FFC7B|nr:uncharacterized protein LOC126837934 [Adelges cooleyi]
MMKIEIIILLSLASYASCAGDKSKEKAEIFIERMDEDWQLLNNLSIRRTPKKTFNFEEKSMAEMKLEAKLEFEAKLKAEAEQKIADGLKTEAEPSNLQTMEKTDKQPSDLQITEKTDELKIAEDAFHDCIQWVILYANCLPYCMVTYHFIMYVGETVKNEEIVKKYIFHNRHLRAKSEKKNCWIDSQAFAELFVHHCKQYELSIKDCFIQRRDAAQVEMAKETPLDAYYRKNLKLMHRDYKFPF